VLTNRGLMIDTAMSIPFDRQLMLWGYAVQGNHQWQDEIWETRPGAKNYQYGFGGRILWDHTIEWASRSFINDKPAPLWFCLIYVAQYAHERGVYASNG
jgi:hypothetical protein